MSLCLCDYCENTKIPSMKILTYHHQVGCRWPHTQVLHTASVVVGTQQQHIYGSRLVPTTTGLSTTLCCAVVGSVDGRRAHLPTRASASPSLLWHNTSHTDCVCPCLLTFLIEIHEDQDLECSAPLVWR